MSDGQTYLNDVDPLNLDEVRIDPAWSLKLPAAVAFRKRVLPLCQLNGTVAVACDDCEDTVVQQHISKLLETDVCLVQADADSLRRAMTRVYGSPNSNTTAATSRVRSAGVNFGDSDDAVAICEEVLQAALLRDASDIHFLPTDKALQVHMRVDGKLELYSEVSLELHGAIISRLKVLAGLDIAEKRSPQDGRFTAKLGPQQQTKVDLRVATMPTRHGERMTLRLLGSHGKDIQLGRLGMNPKDLEIFRKSIHSPHGLVLLTGPTGCGKSTTLYAAILELLARRGGNVITIEDPIEYEISGVSQVEVDSADKVNFTKALRSLLRHDPDVVMIGEIRDLETADIATKAALTGHLVLSTLHTNNSVGVVNRLCDLGMQRFLVAATLRLAIAQRLVRRLCTHCSTPRPLKTEEALALGNVELAGQTIYEPGACVYCAGRGYSGRVAMFEMYPCDEAIAKLIASGASEDALLADMRRRGLPMLLDDGLDKLLGGVTSIQELLSAVVAS